MIKNSLCQEKSGFQKSLRGHSTSVRVRRLAQNLLDLGRP